MTSSAPRTPGGRRAVPGCSADQLLLCFMSTFCLFLILRNADAAAAYIGRGLRLCVGTVIPSLFPFMVISELLVRSGAGEAIGRLLARPMGWLFGLSGAGSTAVVLGSLCGFPMGARTAVGLLDRGAITREECAHLLTFSNNPSAAFLITAVGVSLFGSRRIGVALYAVVLAGGLTVGLTARLLLKRGTHPQRPQAPRPQVPQGLRPDGADTFTAAVSGAVSGMLTVCAYVVFFSALSGTLSAAVSPMSVPPTLWALLCGFLELSGGISEACALPDRQTALVVCAAIAGWSGLSVHCQVTSMCAGRGISLRPYVLAKTAQGAICAGLMRVILWVVPPERLAPAADAAVTALPAVGSLLQTGRPLLPPSVTLAGFAAAWLLRLWEKRLRGRDTRS